MTTAKVGTIAAAAACALAQPGGAQAADVPVYLRDIRPFSAMTLEQKVQELADREEIRQLIATYAQRVNHNKGIADLFTEDAVWTMRTPGGELREIKGGEAIRASFSAFHAEVPSAPMIHNLVIAVDGDTAQAVDMNDLWSTMNGKRYHGWGNYEDSFRRVDGKWLFTARHMDFTSWHEVPAAGK